jgi:hypothetical protein
LSGDLYHKFDEGKEMTALKWILIIATFLPIQVAYGETLKTADSGYFWQAELSGPTRKCNVPSKVKFVVADAIISGKVNFRQNTYFPKGRLEDNKAVELSLIRFYGDQKPLLELTATADGSWTGTWTSREERCAGKARVLPRQK